MIRSYFSLWPILMSTYLTGGISFSSSESTVPKGWRPVANSGADVFIGVDRETKYHGNASGILRRTPSPTAGYGGIKQSVDASGFRGKKIKLTVFVKTADVERAYIYFRGEDKEYGYAHTVSKPIEATNDWIAIQLVLYIPAESERIEFGATLSGEGTIWLDDWKLEPADQEARDENMMTEDGKKQKFPARDYPANNKPTNLGYED